MKLKYAASLKAGDAITSESIEDVGDFPVYGGNGLRGWTSAFTHRGTHVLIGRQGALCGNVQFVEGRFWASEHAVVASPSNGTDARWLYFLLLSLRLNQYSQSAAQPGLAVDVIGNLVVPVPSLSNQRAIADYLDAETARIDALIEKKRRMIELLDERLSAWIEHMLLDGARRLLPMRRLLASLPQYGATESGEDGEAEWPRYIRITDLRADGTLRMEDPKRLKPGAAQPFMLSDGDVLFARSGATVGKSFIYRSFMGPACFAGYLIRISTRSDVLDSRLIEAWTQTGHYWSQIRSASVQATIENVSAERYKELLVPVPPVPEQAAIAASISDARERSAGLRKRLENQIELMQEHRQALITAAVTGELPIPGAAA
jgi:type I restriction enzyme S subunit